jgi:hypothetical protein
MGAAVLATRPLLALVGVHAAIVALPVEIAVGALVYPPSAFLLAPVQAKDVLAMIKKALKSGPPESEQ